MLTRYRMDVVCETVREAVERAGGLICDRSLSGWDVRVFVTDPDHDAVLRILGASRAGSLPQEPEKLVRAVVLSADRYRDGVDFRGWLEQAMGDPLIEVLLWDTGRLPSEVGQVEFPVSRAAIGFLGHARALVGAEPVFATSEFFRRLRPGRFHQAQQRQRARTTVSGV